jgi:ADP-heptose:LPS heptosyltransferase
LAKLLNRDIDLTYQTPLLKLDNKQQFRSANHLERKRLVLFHPGYGGSSDGNLEIDDYIKLANIVRQLDNTMVVWIFGPDDLSIKEKVIGLISKLDIIYHPSTLLDYCFLIRDSELLISTSTGPMHLAGALNINTISFFGNNLFASPERWSTVNDRSRQNNFIINKSFNLNDVELVTLKILC